jgi:hypothetical protein
MKSMPVAVALIVMGTIVVLGPVIASAYSRAANREHIAEYYKRMPPTAELPEAMRPAGTGAYAWACWLAGAGMVFAGIRMSRIQPPLPESRHD